MTSHSQRWLNLAVAAACCTAVFTAPGFAQSNFPPEEFDAIAIVNNNLGSGAGHVIMHVDRWSTSAERDRLAGVLFQKGPSDLLTDLRKAPRVGFIKTPDSLGYDLHYAYQAPAPDGGRQIVIATDRPVSFWEASHSPRVSDYPFTIIQMQIDKDGKGKGTLSYATKISTKDKSTIELENFATSPAMLTEITAKPVK